MGHVENLLLMVSLKAMAVFGKNAKMIIREISKK
jgi:hypothetical protein